MKLTVNLEHHQYDLIIEKSSLKNVGLWVASLWNARTLVVITDSNVEPLYLAGVLDSLAQASFAVFTFTIPAGEQSKSLTKAAEIYAFLTTCNITRSDGIIALGGGVVGDLAGFVASTFLRGIHFLQIPTTLLAQVDSSIGGKTAVNTPFGKNLIGTFAQPDGVLIDPEVLGSLTNRTVREGIAEIVKYAAILDKNLWNKLTRFEDEFDLLRSASEIIYDCCDLKRQVVEEDEFDNGQRLLLNFGHTIGHALEKTAGFSEVTHGEGVAIGMVQITKVAEQKGLSPKGITKYLSELLKKFHLPVSFEPWEVEQLFDALIHDKKARGSVIKTVILEKIGKAKLNEISFAEMKEYLK